MNYRLTIHPALEADKRTISFKFETEEQMKAAAQTSADLLLFIQDKLCVMSDYSSIFIEEVKQDGEWVELWVESYE